MLKIKKSFYPWAAASLICMGAIFLFSSQSADESGELSGAVTRRLVSGTLFGIDGTEAFMEILEVLVRKAAHVAIYAVLSFCAAYTVRQVTEDKRYIFWIAVGWCSFYAVTDELHQYFVPGRAGMWQDWLLDTAGALIGAGAAMLAMRLIEARRLRLR